ncbi:WAT1-related protein At1g43650-like [Phragmites australis]|uniref:WAT1-related protein At1g43650-like n=1 Tax=Phragmites australis TaxID=29695 RepID=UPI002D79236F|nr:WAT1-related protein At1g43650-like [Phragmites australis]
MAPPRASETGGVWSRYAPHVLMALTQLCYTLMYFITEAAFNRGLNPYVYVTYRHLLVAVLLWPFAYYHEKKLRPKMTLMLFLEIFVLSLLGVSLTLNMYFASLRYTSPTFVTSMVNTIATITFVIAIILRMEIVDVKSLRGLAKIAGTVVSFVGVTTMTLYKGAAITSLWKSPIHIQGGSVAHEGWMKGSVLAVASCICWSIWYIMQASSLKRYPAQLSLTVWMSMVGGIQSTAFTVFMQHKPEDWLIGFGLKFWCIVYSGLACNGFTVFVQLWCTEKKGPVFVTMFNPLTTIMVAILAYFIFGENLYVGSIIGGVVVILGLYMLLWGKEKDQEHGASKEQEPELDCEKQAKVSDDYAVQNETEAPKTIK